ncbi:TPA: type I-F CRISPR-associated endoribonuclease Cas6/Csy4 [Enterobacter hormaechei subsp. xiangfangensis]|nr:type I-F CRISPR-associated endoribonuclease Cas6/Csy4 [Enterobacter hormaechei subsp. xiangfangensis]
MKSYVDIRLMPDTEFTGAAVLEKLWVRWHAYLVTSGARLAVSFPQNSADGLGDVMRVHGDKDALAELVGSRWAKGVYDYIQIGSVSDVPADARHCAVRRVQLKTNADRLRRRAERRGNLNAEQIETMFTAWNEQRYNCPFLRYHSASTGQKAIIHLTHTIVDEAQHGDFNTFGLSRTATVPFF